MWVSGPSIYWDQLGGEPCLCLQTDTSLCTVLFSRLVCWLPQREICWEGSTFWSYSADFCAPAQMFSTYFLKLGTTEGPSCALRERLPLALGEFQSVFPGSEVLQRKGEGKGQTWVWHTNPELIRVKTCSLPVGQKPLRDGGQGWAKSERTWTWNAPVQSPILAAAISREPLDWSSLVNHFWLLTTKKETYFLFILWTSMDFYSGGKRKGKGAICI